MKRRNGKFCARVKKCNRCCERKHKKMICRKCCQYRRFCRKSKIALVHVVRKVKRISKKLRKAYIVKSKKGLKLCQTYTRCGCAGKRRRLFKKHKNCCRKVNVCKKYIRPHHKKCCRFIKSCPSKIIQRRIKLIKRIKRRRAIRKARKLRRLKIRKIMEHRREERKELIQKLERKDLLIKYGVNKKVHIKKKHGVVQYCRKHLKCTRRCSKRLVKRRKHQCPKGSKGKKM